MRSGLLCKTNPIKPNFSNGRLRFFPQYASHFTKYDMCLSGRIYYNRSMKTKFEAILFDLDGTLLDTLVDLANAMNAALAKMGFAVHPVDSYRYFVGDGIENEARRALPKGHLDEKTIAECVAMAEKEYHSRWAENTVPYRGIPKLLLGLEGRGVRKTILSNKPDKFTQVMVSKLLAKWRFEIVRGAMPSIPKKPDPTGALQIADELGIEPGKFIYLGDTDTDMSTANAAGMYAVGALWGFRTAEELKANGAKVLVERPGDVLKLFAD